MVVWVPGIWNADAVLGSLQGICKRLLVPEVQMLFLVWGFARVFLETVHFLMAKQGTPHKGVYWFLIRN